AAVLSPRAAPGAAAHFPQPRLSVPPPSAAVADRFLHTPRLSRCHSPVRPIAFELCSGAACSTSGFLVPLACPALLETASPHPNREIPAAADSAIPTRSPSPLQALPWG